MADISKITLPSGTTYDIKDATARSAIESLNSFEYTVSKTAATTPAGVTWDDGGTTITGTLAASASTMYKIYLVPSSNGPNNSFDEYITLNTTGTTYVWERFGSTAIVPADLGDMAYVDTASASYTPGGSVSLTNGNKTATVSPAASGAATYTPAGSITGGSFTGASMTSTGSFTPAGNVTLTSGNKTATVSPAGSGAATYTPTGSITGGSFTGASMTSTGNFTPAGSVSLTNSNTTATVSAASSGTTTYTPAGSITAGAISLATAGTTTTIHNPTKATVATAVTAAAPGATAPSNAITYYSVNNETLSLYQLGYNTGDSISTSDVTVKTGDGTYTGANPTFSGTAVRLVTGNISVPSSASFSGTEGSVSVTGTTTGSVSTLGFSGTGVRLVTDNISVPTGATFNGTEGSVSVTGTTTGSVSALGFSGTGVRLVTGNISVPTSATFNGTATTITVTPDSE